MTSINNKTLQDLEFNTVLSFVSSLCVTESGKDKAMEIVPFKTKEQTLHALKQTSEYLASFTNNNVIPNHYFDAIDYELKFLGIEDSFLEISSFKKIYNLTETTSNLIAYFKKFSDYYPHLAEDNAALTLEKSILKEIENVLDKYGEIKDNASVDLLSIRKSINLIRGKINQSFGFALSQYNSAGYLDDIRETIVDNRRVLAVIAMHRRKVKGSVLGQSKTGSIIYIEPEATLHFSRELNNLEYEEREEIVRILKALTNSIRPFRDLLLEYTTYLTLLDITAGKAKYALKINGLLPEIREEKTMYFREAYHPILWLNNKEKRKITHPQTIQLEQDSRIIVISGPNAGGKSITLKTVGLLQLMLQSGLLIPVHERSHTFLFDRILTDIGDNQSIENHLSTYSSRLRKMSGMIRGADATSLLLIDEFGTGSDPELGGALAESFLEFFYDKKSFGIITTHYTNIKLVVEQLPSAENAAMLFDEDSLEPLYKLEVGQAGSSFTFEVAEKNKIPRFIINSAKKKVEKDVVNLDKTIVKLQQEKFEVEKLKSDLAEKKESVEDKRDSQRILYKQIMEKDERIL